MAFIYLFIIYFCCFFQEVKISLVIQNRSYLAASYAAELLKQTKVKLHQLACCECPVLEVPLCNLAPSIAAVIPCDRVVQSAYFEV